MFSIWTKTPHHLCCKFTWQLPPRLIWKLTVPLKPFERVSIVDIADFSYGAFIFLNSSLSYYLSSLCVSFNIFCSRVLEKDARATQVIVLKQPRSLPSVWKQAAYSLPSESLPPYFESLYLGRRVQPYGRTKCRLSTGLIYHTHIW